LFKNYFSKIEWIIVMSQQTTSLPIRHFVALLKITQEDYQLQCLYDKVAQL